LRKRGFRQVTIRALGKREPECNSGTKPRLPGGAGRRLHDDNGRRDKDSRLARSSPVPVVSVPTPAAGVMAADGREQGDDAAQ
jgi:hypothetical protein